jgi:hypothetical protein
MNIVRPYSALLARLHSVLDACLIALGLWDASWALQHP